MLKSLEIVNVVCMPDILEEGKLYISQEYKTAIHLCACGCKGEVVTPFDKICGWVLTLNGDKATLSPSIGNFGFKCHSHYWLRDNQIIPC